VLVLSKLSVQQDNAGHRERLRERFAQGGLEGFHGYEVIEFLLTLAHPRGDCKVIAKQAIKEFGSVRGVLDASDGQLMGIEGIGDITASTIKFARALIDWYYHEQAFGKDAPLGCSRAVVDYLRVSMGALDRERFSMVYLDAQNQPSGVEKLFEGTLTSSVVYPREVFKAALAHKAKSVIFVHNHPSGCVDPSEQDRQITRDLVLASSYMDVTVLDHIIVGADSHYSFADHGLVQEYRRQAAEFQESRRRLS